MNLPKTLFFFLMVCAFLSAQTEAENQRLNVLFIISDDLNCDIGAYGNTQIFTPNIGKLAQRGVLFGNAHNQYPWCAPSRASMMTGLYPDQTNIKKLRIYLVYPKIIRCFHYLF